MGGAFVKQMTFERLTTATEDLFFMNQMSFTEICKARLEIEPIIARLAAENCNPEYAKKLIAACEQESSTLAYPETIYLRRKVHFILAEMCENRYLMAISKSLIELVGNITQKFQPPTDDIHPPGMHSELVQAVINNDGEGAEKAMYRHLKDFLDILQAIETEYRQNSMTNSN